MTASLATTLVWALLVGLSVGIALVILDRIATNLRRVYVELHQFVGLYERASRPAGDGEPDGWEHPWL